jgi:hypothetical protein
MDYTQFAPAVLALVGISFQWIRQYASNSEWIPPILAGVLATGVYFVVHPLTEDWRLEVLLGIIGIGGYTASVLGGTYGASRSASGGIKFIPVTNSK